MTRDQLRTQLVGGIDRILGHTFLVSAETAAFLRIVRAAYQADDVLVDQMLTHFQASPRGPKECD